MNVAPEVFTILASEDDVSQASYESYEFYKPTSWPKPIKVNEATTREDSLNQILLKRDKNKDCLIFVDDIIFQEQLTDKLLNEAYFYDIWGGIMTHPKTAKVQNCGFRFINVDNELSYKPLDYSEFRDQQCDFFTGCFMFIKKEYLNNVNNFPTNCYNRWEEIIFIENAKKNGAKAGIIDFKLSHHGNSTKKNKDLKLSSISWLIEKDLWNNVVRNDLQHIKPPISLDTLIDDDLQLLIESETQKIFYGAGINTYKLLCNTRFRNVEIVSGLNEELGMNIKGCKIKNLSDVEFESKTIIITPIGYDDEITSLLKKYTDSKPKFLSLEISKKHNKLKIKPD